MLTQACTLFSDPSVNLIAGVHHRNILRIESGDGYSILVETAYDAVRLPNEPCVFTIEGKCDVCSRCFKIVV